MDIPQRIQWKSVVSKNKVLFGEPLEHRIVNEMKSWEDNDP